MKFVKNELSIKNNYAILNGTKYHIRDMTNPTSENAHKIAQFRDKVKNSFGFKMIQFNNIIYLLDKCIDAKFEEENENTKTNKM